MYDRLMKFNSYLDLAYAYAQKKSGCNKVAVGSLISKDGSVVSMGANRTMPDLCKCRGCLRVEKYGNDSKSHRNPEDCRAIHSEIDAITSAAQNGISLDGATIYVTRYPCEACARAIVSSGIRHVVYGGTAKISDQTQILFDDYDIDCVYIPNWKEDNSDR